MKCIKLSDKAGTVVNLDHVQYLSKGRDDGKLFIQLRGCYFDLKGSDEDIAIDAARIERAMLSGQVKHLLPINKPRSSPCEVIGFVHPVLGRVRAALMLTSAGTIYAEGVAVLPDDSPVVEGMLVAICETIGEDQFECTLLVRNRDYSIVELVSWGEVKRFQQ